MKTSNHLFNKSWQNCYPVQEVDGGGSRELHRFGAGESSASAKTVTNTSFEYHLLQNEQLQIYRDQKLVETTCKSVIFFPCKTQ